MRLKSSPKIFENYKCDYPENTVRKIEEGFKKLGLNLKYRQREITANGFSTYSSELLIEELGFFTVGKGFTSPLTKASAYAEMAERFSSGFFVFHTITDKIKEYSKLLETVIERKFLKGFKRRTNSSSATPEEADRYIEDGVSSKEFQILKNQGLFDVLVKSYSFIHREYIEIPIRFVELVSGSTGLAAGNTVEEALTQAACEIFERYAAYKILSKKIVCPTISIESIKDDRIQVYVRMFRSMNIEVIIKDFSLNKELPVIGVLFNNRNIEKDENQLKKSMYYKMIDVGSHVDLNQAILRCFIERLQGLTKEEFMYRRTCDVLHDFWTKQLKKEYKGADEFFKDFFVNYETSSDLSFLEDGNEISLDELGSSQNKDCLKDCETIIGICEENNWDIQAIDYTHRVLKFPVLRVIIPPISTSHDPYVFKALKIENHRERFNFLYGIKDFYRFVAKDDWMKNKCEIKRLTKKLEEFLSENLLSFRFCIRQGHFHYPVNLFEVLAFSNLSLGNYVNAAKYFNVLLQLNDKPPFYSPYFNVLLNPGYNPVLHSAYARILQTLEEDKGSLEFTFEYNPFKPRTVFTGFEPFFHFLLEKISRSFFG